MRLLGLLLRRVLRLGGDVRGLLVICGPVCPLVLLHDLLDSLVVEVTALGLFGHGFDGARLNKGRGVSVSRLLGSSCLLVQG